MRRNMIANLATATFFLLAGAFFIWAFFNELAWQPDCLRSPASCDVNSYLHGKWDQARLFGIAVLFFAFAARVIWNMRQGRDD